MRDDGSEWGLMSTLLAGGRGRRGSGAVAVRRIGGPLTLTLTLGRRDFGAGSLV